MPSFQRRFGALLLGALLAPLVDLASAQVTTEWADVCTSAAFSAQLRDDLCPPVFLVSSLSFHPNAPGVDANLTLILQPSTLLPPPGSENRQQFLDIRLPGFTPVGVVDPNDASMRFIQVEGRNPVGFGEDPVYAYNSYMNPLFEPNAQYDTTSGSLLLKIKRGLRMLRHQDTEIRICCMQLPRSSPENNQDFTLFAETDEFTISVDLESIKSTPAINPGLQWDYLQVMFNPPVSQQLAVISLTMRSANPLSSRARIILRLPGISREVYGEDSDIVTFNTQGSGDGTDWMLFDHEALWNETSSELTLFLREGSILEAYDTVTINTNAGEFRLPTDLEANAQMLMVSARSFDNVDEIIAPTSIHQSSVVPYVLTFTHSEIHYTVNQPYAHSDVTVYFKTNRPVFAGGAIYLRLAGFSAQVIEVPLLGPNKHYFEGETARFHLPENVLELRLNQTLYANEALGSGVELTFQQLILPAALYANDMSLLIWNSDPAAVQQPIDISPEVGGGFKTFTRSQIQFDPPEPRLPANVTFTLQPSIVMYQGDQIVMYLYDFICQNSELQLYGDGAELIEGRMAHWYNRQGMLVLVVAQNRIIQNDRAIQVIIGLESNFRLPPLLSRNDGTLRMEARAAEMIMPDLSHRTLGVSPHIMITKEQMKKVPAIGDQKYVIGSRIDFETTCDREFSITPRARIKFNFVLNCDVLPNSTINITLGGLLRKPPCANQLLYQEEGDENGGPLCKSGQIALSGENAPLFSGVGDWSQDEVVLSIHTIPHTILAGEQVRFFIECNEYFRLPSASYANDPSYRLSIPGAGIADQQFQNSTKFADIKRFVYSKLVYNSEGSTSYPGDVVDLHLEFQPNVNLPGGSEVRITLPGFMHTGDRVKLDAPPANERFNERVYLSGNSWEYASWNQLTHEMIITVLPRRVIESKINVVKVLATGNGLGFSLPITALEPNDQSLTIACIKNQMINDEPIQTSPRVVQRTFLISQFTYSPAVKESIFLLEMLLKPAVNITPAHPIVISLPNFRNSLSKQLIEVRGRDRDRIEMSRGMWNESTQQLTLQVANLIESDTELELKIEESQGFILPQRLEENDPTLTIAAVGNILTEEIKTSPMVGNMPSSNHWFCMYQYEVGVRSRDPVCPSAVDCEPPLTDPCNPTELLRCGCNPRLDEVFNLTVQGFMLRPNDQLYFVRQQELCAEDNDRFTTPFSEPLAQPVVSDNQERVAFYGISSVETGYFRMCYFHAGALFDIGNVVVRPSCEHPKVLVGGTCVEHCPKTKIPIAGECLRDSAALLTDDAQAYMLAVQMDEPMVGENAQPLAQRTSDDAEVRYFNYRYVYELARLLNADPIRIEVASLSSRPGSLIVNTVFAPVGDAEAIAQTTERSPMGLVSLSQAMRSDTSSLMYTSSFFSSIDKPSSLDQAVTRQYLPLAISVRMCANDGVYRVLCPYTGDIVSNMGALAWFIGGTLIIPVVLLLLGGLAWRIDFDHPSAVSEDVLEKLKQDPRLVEPQVQVEYARSWLEGRFTGEEWQRARHSKMLQLGN